MGCIMRMRVTWLKLNTNIDQNGKQRLKETPHINGKYCKRNEVESVLERVHEMIEDTTNELNQILNDANELQSTLTQEQLKICNRMMNKINDLQYRTKKCKRQSIEDIKSEN